MDTNGTAGIDIPGWTITLEGVSWIATRDEPLTAQQERCGCRTRVQATTPQELRLLCSGEDVHAGFVAAADRMVAVMAEHGREWRERTADADAPPDPAAFMSRKRPPADPDDVMPASRDDWRVRR